MIWPERFAPQAARDVEKAMDWLEENAGPDVARRMLEAVLHGARRVMDRPLIGRARPGLLPARYRFWATPAFPYLIVYDVGCSPPEIMRVVHMSRDLEVVLADLKEL